MSKTSLIILGSTGSIGTQALSIIDDYPNEFEVLGLVANGISDASRHLFKQQCEKYLAPNYKKNHVLSSVGGFDSVLHLIADIVQQNGTKNTVVLNGITGSIGLQPSLKSLEIGAKLALANKESLVVGGTLIANAVGGKNKMLQRIHAVDSEHSAIWQCLMGGHPFSEIDDASLISDVLMKDVDKLILTASGGPFRGKTRDQLKDVTPKQALNHPTWKMGPVVTINSATLMNKALEVIEACYLFNCKPEDILVTVHPQSIVHSMVRLNDGSILAEATPPDMRLPIALGLTSATGCNPFSKVVTPLDFEKSQSWDFEPLDTSVFEAVDIARNALNVGPLYPVAMNATNEVAVDAFLKGEIGFLDIMNVVKTAIESFNAHSYAVNPETPTLEEVLNLDKEIRKEIKI